MDKLAHGLALYSAIITLHLLGVGSLPSLGGVTLGAVAYEAWTVKPKAEYQADLVAGLSGMLLGEAVWQNTEVRRRASEKARLDKAAAARVCAVMKTCPESVFKALPRSGPTNQPAGVHR